MKTQAQLKRDLQVGKELICIYHYREDRKDNKRIIEEVRTNYVVLTNKVHCYFADSSVLLEYDNDTFTIYEAGTRKATTEEAENRYKCNSDKFKGCFGTFKEPFVYDKQIRGKKLYTFKIV